MNDIILNTLANDARISITDLANIVNEEPTIVSNKIKELEDNKIICGYHTIINWSKTSNEKVQAIIQVSSKPTTDFGYDDVARKIACNPEVSDLYLMSGRYEFTVIINGKTMKEVALFVSQKLAIQYNVIGTATHFVLKKYKEHGTIFKEKKNPHREAIFV